MLPLRLFREPHLHASRARIGLLVGVAMFGAISFLPLFLQVVQGRSPTDSGLLLLPLMVRLLLTLDLRRPVITRTGRYRSSRSPGRP